MSADLQLRLIENGAEPERMETLASFLRVELLHCDVETVAVLPAGAPPPGARAIDASVVGGLLVSLGRTASGLRSVVQVLQRWQARGNEARTVRMEINGDVLQLSNASAADQARLIELFVDRHAPREGAG